ncbi:hypothetical protein [Herbiconiux sp. L3-i23]|uniref:hypothetical protein n=1 Tax=Herbiconiux sp. L3-i23 TaxID=2905871 RepID=UPI002067D50A|nr:hypothetical protein [Herbiconiux sp. L3-i23]BDI21456.1 hypothetical protein L3i23_02320 [Herbiconiux sp. L3-i23]
MAETEEVLNVWASMAGLIPSSASPDTIVGWGDFEVAHEVRRAGDRFAVVKVERSANLIGTFSDQTTAELLLVLLLARIWRAKEGLPRVDTAELAPGVELEEGAEKIVLRYAGGDAEFSVGRPGRWSALEVSHLVWRTPQELTNELIMPDASGLFAPRSF